jgi:hypothetical protein
MLAAPIKKPASHRPFGGRNAGWSPLPCKLHGAFA